MTAPLPEPDFNPNASMEFLSIGTDQEPVLVIDNVLLNPDVMIEYAAQSNFGPPPESSRYPGRVAPLPDSYRSQITELLRHPMVGTFGTNPGFRPANYGFFGLATTPAQDMLAAQAAPHIDSHRLNSFATVHYLSRAPFGGTAFFRHKATGYEVVTPIRSDGYRRKRRQELDEYKDRPLADILALYEEIAYVEATFNRLVFYRASLFHSARMESRAGLSDDPRKGRLTANMFFNTEGL
jgi:hypothetical protein